MIQIIIPFEYLIFYISKMESKDKVDALAWSLVINVPQMFVKVPTRKLV